MKREDALGEVPKELACKRQGLALESDTACGSFVVNRGNRDFNDPGLECADVKEPVGLEEVALIDFLQGKVFDEVSMQGEEVTAGSATSQ